MSAEKIAAPAQYEEKELRAINGLSVLFLDLVLCIASIFLIILGAPLSDSGSIFLVYLGVLLIVAGVLYLCIGSWFILLGNPIIIGIAVIWRVENTAKAVFGVDNYLEFLSIQCDSALRNIVRLYPYDLAEEGEEKTLRGSAQEISESLRQEIQNRVTEAGLEVLEARITHLAYAPEIAAAMLQRQQASAIIDARKMIVEGAVGMVSMALEKLSADQVVELDEERRAQMVSNLMVVLCSNKDAQPVVNSGSIYG